MSSLLNDNDAAVLPVAIASSAVLAKKSIVANSTATRFKTRWRNGGEIVVVVVVDVAGDESMISCGTIDEEGAMTGDAGM